MRRSLVWRVLWMGTLAVLFSAGVALSQVARPALLSGTAWSGPFQPDIGGSDNRSQQPGTSTDMSIETPADNATNSAANSADLTTSDDNGIRQLGTPFPLQLQPQGLKIGPFYLTSISDSAFYAVETSPGQPTQTLVGNSTTASLSSSKQLGRGSLAFQANEQLSIAGSQPYFNQTAGL